MQDVLPVFLKAFEGYFVPMPTSIDYWASRFDLALVDFSASYGAFHNGELVAFIIHAIDQKQGRKVGFNTGTGVLPPFRGQHLVDQMYHMAIDDLARQGVHRFELEVIVENHAAIAVYERLGFKVSRTFKCYSGGLDNTHKAKTLSLQPCTVSDCISHQTFTDYSWDFRTSVIERADNKYCNYLVKTLSGEVIGYFIIDEKSGTLAQIDARRGCMLDVLASIKPICNSIKINNIDSGREDVLAALDVLGPKNTIDQFEMCWSPKAGTSAS